MPLSTEHSPHRMALFMWNGRKPRTIKLLSDGPKRAAHTSRRPRESHTPNIRGRNKWWRHLPDSVCFPTVLDLSHSFVITNRQPFPESVSLGITRDGCAYVWEVS